MNKKGFQLSINMIVLIILAVIVLVLAIVFITDMINKARETIPWPDPTQPCTLEQPITYAPLVFERGKDNQVTLCFYNNEQAAVPATVEPELTCANMEGIEVTVTGAKVDVGSSFNYKPLVKVPSNTPAGPYTCVVKISETQESLFIEVK